MMGSRSDAAGPPQVLTYGILSAAVLRLVMIGLGAELIERSQVGPTVLLTGC